VFTYQTEIGALSHIKVLSATLVVL